MSWLKSGRLKPTIKGRKGVGVTTLVGLPWLVPGLRAWFPAPTFMLDMVAIQGLEDGKSKEDLEESIESELET